MSIRALVIGQKWLGGEVVKRLAAKHIEVLATAPKTDSSVVSAAGVAGTLFTHHDDQCRLLNDPGGSFDILIAAHAHVKIPFDLRKRARWSIGYHPSLLPLFRGKDAVQQAVNSGQRVTGGTVYHLTEEMDRGPVAGQEWCFVGAGQTAAELWRSELAAMGVRLIVRAVDEYMTFGSITARRQRSLKAR